MVNRSMYRRAVSAILAALSLCLLCAPAAWAQAGNIVMPPGQAPLPRGAESIPAPSMPGNNAPGAVGGGAERRFPPGADAAVYEDVQSDGVWLVPTALTPPKGSVLLQSQELFGLIASVGVTDRVQLTGLMIAIPGAENGLFAAELKGRLIQSGRLRIAMQGRLIGFSEDDADDTTTTANAGLIATLCLDEGCHSLLNGYLGTFFLLDRPDDSFVVGSAGLTAGLSKHLKLLVELNTGAEDGELSQQDAFLVWYGARVMSSRLGFDFGFVRPLEESFVDEMPLGLPWLKITVRLR